MATIAAALHLRESNALKLLSGGVPLDETDVREHRVAPDALAVLALEGRDYQVGIEGSVRQDFNPASCIIAPVGKTHLRPRFLREPGHLRQQRISRIGRVGVTRNLSTRWSGRNDQTVAQVNTGIVAPVQAGLGDGTCYLWDCRRHCQRC